MIRTHAALALALAAGLAPAARAQAPRFAPQYQMGHAVQGLSAAETAALRAATRAVVGVIESNPLVRTPPDGYCTRSHAFIPMSWAFDRPATGVGLYALREGRCHNLEMGISVYVNSMHSLLRHAEGFSTLPLEDAQGRMYLQPQPLPDAFGHRAYEVEGSGRVVLTRRRAPLWLPVTRERYARAMLASFRSNDGAQIARAVAEQAAQGSAYARWVDEDRPRVLAEHRRAMEQARPHMSAAQAAEMQALLDSALAGAEATARALDAGRGEAREMAQGAVRWSAGYERGLVAALEAMPPAERAAPACASLAAIEADPANPFGFVPCPAGNAIVVPNPGFFDPSLPPSATQLLVVTGSARHAGHPGPAGVVARIFSTLDYAALAALLR